MCTWGLSPCEIVETIKVEKGSYKMDVAFLLDKYFKGAKNVSIDVFDAQTLNNVYKDVVGAMTSHFEIEVGVLQALSYCLYEMMDNVHIHSGKHKLIRKDGQESIVENGFWQGTLIYLAIGTGEEIDPNQIVDHRKQNPLAERSVLVALQRRYKVISETAPW